MILDLEKLSADLSKVVGDEEVVVRDAEGEKRPVRCHVELEIRKTGEAFYIHADVTGDLVTSCHRCLGPARLRVIPSFDVVLERSREAEAPEADEAGEDYVVVPYGTDRFSLDRHIYENLVVEIPMQIVCDEGCRGLCSGCGANLNTETCRCEAETDSRWDALKKLKKR